MRHHLQIIDEICQELERANLCYELKSLRNEVRHPCTSTELIGGVCSILLKMNEKVETRNAVGHLTREFDDYARQLGVFAEASKSYSLTRKEFEIDGAEFSDLKGFFHVIGQQLVNNNQWGRNWNAFNDILVGGFVRTEYGEPFKLTWKNSAISRQELVDYSDIVELIKSHDHIELDLK